MGNYVDMILRQAKKPGPKRQFMQLRQAKKPGLCVNLCLTTEI